MSPPTLEQALEETGLVVLEVLPSAGKSTLVPLALRNASWLGGQCILILVPRRDAPPVLAVKLQELFGL